MASQVEDATVGVGGLDITIEGSTCVYDFLCFLFFFGSRGELFVVGILGLSGSILRSLIDRYADSWI